ANATVSMRYPRDAVSASCSQVPSRYPATAAATTATPRLAKAATRNVEGGAVQPTNIQPIASPTKIVHATSSTASSRSLDLSWSSDLAAASVKAERRAVAAHPA